MDEPEDSRRLVEQILKDPVLHAEAKQAYIHVTAAIEPATRDQVYAAMQPIMVLRTLPDFGGGPEAQVLREKWIDLYKTALCDLPYAALLEGVDALIKNMTGSFFPQPAEIRKFAEPIATRMRIAQWRLKQAFEAKERVKPKDRSPEEKAEIERILADLKLRLGNKRAGIVKASKPLASSPHEAAERIRRQAADQGL